MIVVDTNALVYLYLPGNFKSLSEALFKFDDEWHAPVLWKSEFRNVLCGYIRRKALTFAEALSLTLDAEDLLAGREHAPETRTVLRLAAESGCSAYDCEFVAVAQTLGVPLFTMDAKILKAFPHTAQPLSPFR